MLSIISINVTLKKQYIVTIWCQPTHYSLFLQYAKIDLWNDALKEKPKKNNKLI